MARYPGLSARQMSEEAQLANNAVTAILSGKTNPTPYTIKKLTDKWGTQEDYLAMMRLAGHLPPESSEPIDISDAELKALNVVREATGRQPVTKTAVATHLLPLEEEIEEFLQEFPKLQNIIEHARARLSDQAMRALMDNIRFFVTHPKERKAFAEAHGLLAGELAHLAPLLDSEEGQ